MLQPNDAMIKIKPEALEILKKKMNPGQIVLLALDDGSNRYSMMGGTCKIGADFQLVLLDQPDPEYPIVLGNDAGLKMYTSSDELGYLSTGLVLNVRNYVFSLYDDTGMIDGSVAVNPFHPKALSQAERVALGAKQC